MSQVEDIGRYECKYTVPLSARQYIIDLVADHVIPDPNGADIGDGAKGYLVHSIYLDTPRLDDYYERLNENKVRDRLRARTYGKPGDHAPVFLENKRKLENWVIKHRVRVCDADAWCASGMEKPWLHWAAKVTGRGKYAARHFARLVETARRRPVSVVHYKRAVYIDPRPGLSKVRLTMDINVCATVNPGPCDLYAPPDVDLLPPDWMVLEMKFNETRPGWMRMLAKELKLRAVPVSKFGLSVAKGVAGSKPREVRYLTPHAIRQLGWGL